MRTTAWVVFAGTACLLLIAPPLHGQQPELSYDYLDRLTRV